MNANDWVAEHVMGFERGPCGPYPSGPLTLYEFRPEDYCERCGELRPIGDRDLRPDGGQRPCPKGSFPNFALVDLMRKLGEKGDPVIVHCDARRPKHSFIVTFHTIRIADTDDPLQALCDYLYRHQSLYSQKRKRFVSGEQVLEEYIPDYKRRTNALNWGLLYSRAGECSARIRLLEERFEALLEELPPEVINFRTIRKTLP